MKRLILLPFVIGVAFAQPGARTTLNNPKVQTDIDMSHHQLLNFDSSNIPSLIGLPSAKTVSVDSVNGNDSTGLRGRLDKPFLTLLAGLTAASDGDYIIWRGAFTSSNVLTISKNNLIIDAYGVKLTASSKTNGTKLIVTGSDVTINGLEVDGIGTPERTLTDVVLNSTSTVASATGAFTSADVGRRPTFRNQKNAFAGNVIASITNGTTVVMTGGVGATKTGVNMEIWANDGNSGAIEISGARCHLNEVYVHDYASHLIRLNSGSDGFRALKCRLENGTDGISGANYSATPIHDVWIEGCTAKRCRYDSFRLSTEGYSGTGASYRGVVITGNISHDACNFGVELFGSEAAEGANVNGNYIENSGLGGISMAAVNHSSASNNQIIGYYGTGIEWAENHDRSYNLCENNVIDEANEDGTYQDAWQSGVLGISISDNYVSIRDIKLQVQGNTIAVPNGQGIGLRQVYGVYFKGNYTYTGGAAYVLQAPASDIDIENAFAEILNGSAYGVFFDTSAQTSTGFHFINNRFIRLAGASDGYPIYQSYSTGGAQTINDVVIAGTRTNMTFGGSGFYADTGGNTVNLIQVNNVPQTAAYGNSQNGFTDFQRWYSGSFTSNLNVGDGYVDGATATPATINLGKSYSNTAGNHGKAVLYDGGDNGGVASYWLGVSASSMDVNVATGAAYNFRINGVSKAKLNSSGQMILILPTSCSGLASGTLYNNSGTPAICP